MGFFGALAKLRRQAPMCWCHVLSGKAASQTLCQLSGKTCTSWQAYSIGLVGRVWLPQCGRVYVVMLSSCNGIGVRHTLWTSDGLSGRQWARCCRHLPLPRVLHALWSLFWSRGAHEAGLGGMVAILRGGYCPCASYAVAWACKQCGRSLASRASLHSFAVRPSSVSSACRCCAAASRLLAT